MFQHVRAWSHQRHVPQEHIDQLWQFVNVCLSHEVSELRLSRVILCCLHLVCILVHLHASELVAPEFLSVDTVSFLFEEDRSRRRYLDDTTRYQIDKGEDRTEEESRHHHIESPLHHPVVKVVQRFAVQAQYRYIPHCVIPHSPVQIVSHIRHIEEVREVLFAPVDNGQYHLTLRRVQSAIHIIHLVLLHPFHHAIRSTQVVYLF